MNKKKTCLQCSHSTGVSPVVNHQLHSAVKKSQDLPKAACHQPMTGGSTDLFDNQKTKGFASRNGLLKNKKAQWAELEDVFLGGLIISVAFLTFMGFMQFRDYNQGRIFEEKTRDLNNDFLFRLLSHEFEENTRLSDLIINADAAENTRRLEENLDGLLEEIYSQKVCWRLLKRKNGEDILAGAWIGTQLNSGFCNSKGPNIESNAILPLPNKKTLGLTLIIRGYKK